MESISTNNLKGRTVIALILDSYRQYCSFGYPSDPNIYEVRASGRTYLLLNDYIASMPDTGSKDKWPFKVTQDTRILPGEVFFGPEQVRIIWRGKDGLQ
jgi:hypothetical protein